MNNHGAESIRYLAPVIDFAACRAKRGLPAFQPEQSDFEADTFTGAVPRLLQVGEAQESGQLPREQQIWQE
jgi:hypothetical protein